VIRLRIGICLALSVAALFAQQGVNFFTVDRERALGQQLASEVRERSKPFAHPAVDAYVRRIGPELVARLQDRIFEYQFDVVESGTWTEPFSLPGGYVFIPARAFLAAQDEDEFAYMLAHAIGHAALRHGTRTATRAQLAKMASIPLIFVGGAHADAASARALMPAAFLKFQREYELEADLFGVELAARAGYDPAAFLRYVGRVQPPDSKMSPLPLRDVRVNKLREAVSSIAYSPSASSNEEFRNVQQVVRSLLP
jgi:predicted Zn-dependent protease